VTLTPEDLRKIADDAIAAALAAEAANTADGSCSKDGCTASAVSSSNKHALCRQHYNEYLVEYRKERGKPTMCVADNCDKPQEKRGYCGVHYRESTRKRENGKCFTVECESDAVVIDWCPAHHRQLHGSRKKCVAVHCDRKVHAAALCRDHIDAEIMARWFWIGVDNPAPE
jgi:hypothetical protein